MSNLFGKTVAVIGSGYVGTAISRKLASFGVRVSAISRSGLKEDIENVKSVKGDAMKPISFENCLFEADAVIHTIGTFFDTSLTKFSNPGDEGTYEKVNRDAAISIGSCVESFKIKKRMVYISATHHPPFFPRYLTTKEEAEKFLLNLSYVQACVLKPGFIYSEKERSWGMPIKYGIDFGGVFLNPINKVLSENCGKIKSFAKNFEVPESVELEEVVAGAVFGAFDAEFEKKFIWNSDMRAMKKFLEQKDYQINIKKNEESEQEEKDEDKK